MEISGIEMGIFVGRRNGKLVTLANKGNFCSKWCNTFAKKISVVM